MLQCYAIGEEALWLVQNASIGEQEKTSQLGDSKDDDEESLNGGRMVTNIKVTVQLTSTFTRQG